MPSHSFQIILSLLLVVLTVVHAQQIPLRHDASVEYPVPISGPINFTEVFGTDDKKTPRPWSQNTYNGLVTYAKTRPVRCFGDDADELYDVAILGAFFLSLRDCS